MSTIDLSVQTSVLALVRGDVTASFVADRFGVTEAQVHEWRDTFVAAGVLALDESLRGRRRGTRRRLQSLGTTGLEEPTTDNP